MFIYQARITHMDIVGPYYSWVLVADSDSDTEFVNLFIEGDNVALIVNDMGCFSEQERVSHECIICDKNSNFL